MRNFIIVGGNDKIYFARINIFIEQGPSAITIIYYVHIGIDRADHIEIDGRPGPIYLGRVFPFVRLSDPPYDDIVKESDKVVLATIYG